MYSPKEKPKKHLYLQYIYNSTASMRLILYFFLLFCLTAYDMMAQLTTVSPKRELRAVWLTTLSGLDWPYSKATNDYGIQRQKKELRDILDKLQSANFNAVVFQVRTRSAVVYPSSIEPWDVCLTGKYGQNPGYDPLAFAVEECHRRGLQIHAWLVAIPGNKFAQSKVLGNKAIEKRVPNLCLKTSEGYMLNPGIPETADYLASLCEEITRNYDIDGINLDYIRYPEKEIKYNDAATYKKYAPKGQSLTEWRRNNLSYCVKTIHDRVKAIKPWVVISCSPIGKYNDTQRYQSGGWNAYRAVFQDAKLWLSKGWMDILMPMMYFQGNHFFPFALDWQESVEQRHVTPGLGVYLIDRRQKNWSRSIIESEIEFCRTHNMGGQVFFRSRFITDNVKGIYDLLKSNIYRQKALVPPLAGDGIPLPEAPKKEKNEQTELQTTLSWSPVSGCTYILYRSNTYPVDTQNSANIYRVNLSESQIVLEYSLPLAALPYYAVTAINRYGRESSPLELNKPQNMMDLRPYQINSK